MMQPKIYGYFTNGEQTDPTYDPGLAVNCPVCNQMLSRPMVTLSLMFEGDNRSYFYRVHKSCYDALTDEQQNQLDSLLIDAIGSTKNSN